MYVTELIADRTTSMPKSVLPPFKKWIRVSCLNLELGFYFSCSRDEMKTRVNMFYTDVKVLIKHV